MQVSLPGRATPTRGWLKRGRGKVSPPKNSPPSFKKMKATRFTSFAALRSPFFHVFDSILHYYSSPTCKYLILGISSFPLMYFGALSCMYLLINVRDLSLNCCLFLLNWGVVGDGPRSMVHSEIMGHAALPPFPCYSCPNMRPPSVWWNASMAFAHNFVKLSLWNELCTYGCHCECVGSFVEARLKCRKHDLRLGI